MVVAMVGGPVTVLAYSARAKIKGELVRVQDADADMSMEMFAGAWTPKAAVDRPKVTTAGPSGPHPLICRAAAAAAGAARACICISSLVLSYNQKSPGNVVRSFVSVQAELRS